MMKLTSAEISNLVECPDCHGTGTHTTPAKNWNKTVLCGICDGKGWITKWDSERLLGEASR